MKKLLPLIVTALFLLLLVACHSTPSNSDKSENDATQPNYEDSSDTTLPDTRPTEYLLKTYSSTDEHGNAGTYTEINAKYSAGENIELEATVNAGYNFVGWFINGTCVSEDLKYTFTMEANNITIEARYNYFTVLTSSHSDDYEKAGTYTELKSKKISVGEQVTVEATVNAGYNFDGWFINNVCVSEKLTYSFVMKEKDVDLEARWSYYTVSVDSNTDEQGTAGTFTKKNDEKISVGETVTLTATVNKGFNFEGWYVNGNRVSGDCEYSFTMKDENVYVEAVYSYYTVSVDSNTDEQGTAGTFTKKNNEKISVGETVTLTATVNKGFNFEGWYVNGNRVSGDCEYSFTMKDENVYVEAVYSYYSITVESLSDEQGTAGTYPKKDNEKISAGETVTLTATVADGYNFEGWYVDGVCVCSELTYQFVMEKADKFIRAEYSYYTFSSYGLVAKSGWLGDTPIENVIGTCTSYDRQKTTSGEIIKLKATVCKGYNFEGWYLGDICVSTDYEYSYTMTKESVDLVARYTYYTLTVYATEDGSVDFSGDLGNVSCYDEEKVQVGETITLTATAKNGYRFIGWTHGRYGITVSTDSTYTFVMPATDECYVAVFERT